MKTSLICSLATFATLRSTQSKMTDTNCTTRFTFNGIHELQCDLRDIPCHPLKLANISDILQPPKHCNTTLQAANEDQCIDLQSGNSTAFNTTAFFQDDCIETPGTRTQSVFSSSSDDEEIAQKEADAEAKKAQDESHDQHVKQTRKIVLLASLGASALMICWCIFN